MQPLNGLVFAVDGILIGANDLTFLAKAMAGAFVLFVALATAVTALGLGLGWLWAAIVVFMAGRAIPLWRFTTGTWLTSTS